MNDLSSANNAEQDGNSGIVAVQARIETLSFAIKLPNNIFQGFNEPEPKPNTSKIVLGNNNTGVVGTIIVLKNSVNIWFGYGSLIDKDCTDGIGNPSASVPTTTIQDSKSINDGNTKILGSGSNQIMGQFMVAMPRTNYSRGSAFSDNEASTSKLIGGEEDEMICRQMSSRLSSRLGIPIFISCSFKSMENQLQGMDYDTINQRAAALAEIEIYTVLKQKFKKN